MRMVFLFLLSCAAFAFVSVLVSIGACYVDSAATCYFNTDEVLLIFLIFAAFGAVGGLLAEGVLLIVTRIYCRTPFVTVMCYGMLSSVAFIAWASWDIGIDKTAMILGAPFAIGFVVQGAIVAAFMSQSNITMEADA